MHVLTCIDIFYSFHDILWFKQTIVANISEDINIQSVITVQGKLCCQLNLNAYSEAKDLLCFLIEYKLKI